MTTTGFANTGLHLIVFGGAPIFAIGLINRTKAIWAGREPKPQSVFFDLTASKKGRFTAT